MHERFHRTQAKLRMGVRDAVDSQLDSLGGRNSLQMEWRAVEHALWQALKRAGSP